jgi:hypothetical protein
MPCESIKDSPGICRRIVGNMELPHFLIEMFDPAGRYMRRTAHLRRRRRTSRIPFRSAAYTPIGTDPVPLTDARHEEWLAARQNRVRERAAQREANVVDPEVIAAAAAELVAGRRTTIATPGRRLDAVMVRFWHGDAVLEVRDASQRCRGVRIERRRLGDPAVIARHLATMVR